MSPTLSMYFTAVPPVPSLARRAAPLLPSGRRGAVTVHAGWASARSGREAGRTPLPRRPPGRARGPQAEPSAQHLRRVVGVLVRPALLLRALDGLAEELVELLAGTLGSGARVACVSGHQGTSGSISSAAMLQSLMWSSV